MKMPLWSFLFSSSYNLIALNIERYISIIAPIYHKTKVRIIRSCHNHDVKNAQSWPKISKSTRNFLISKDLNISFLDFPVLAGLFSVKILNVTVLQI